jgi:CHAT domain-containing protein
LVLSLWSVQDKATALLMTRFYENLLGKRTGLDKPLPKAEALREAKHWLRTLPQDEVDRLAAGLASGVRARTRDLRQPAQSSSLHPYEDPYYWAGFILIGDPD